MSRRTLWQVIKAKNGKKFKGKGNEVHKYNLAEPFRKVNRQRRQK